MEKVSLKETGRARKSTCVVGNGMFVRKHVWRAAKGREVKLGIIFCGSGVPVLKTHDRKLEAERCDRGSEHRTEKPSRAKLAAGKQTG